MATYPEGLPPELPLLPEGGPLVAGEAAPPEAAGHTEPSKAAPESKKKRNVDKPVVSDGAPTYPLSQAKNGPPRTSDGFLDPVTGDGGSPFGGLAPSQNPLSLK
jgi:hypothetical protein